MSDIYPTEELNDDYDNGTMPDNVEALRQAVVGHRIVKTERKSVPSEYDWENPREGLVITLDDGTEVRLVDTDDCCAFTSLSQFFLHPEKVDHVIMGVGTTDEFSKWHIYADWGDVLELTVGWSCGNPFYYGYGFDITVEPMPS